MNEDIEMSKAVMNESDMLRNAERHIQKLTHELKDKEVQIECHVRRWQFYEQIVKNLTTFKD